MASPPTPSWRCGRQTLAHGRYVADRRGGGNGYRRRERAALRQKRPTHSLSGDDRYHPSRGGRAMSRGRKQEKGRLPPFVPLLKDTLKSGAWRAMSHGARSLYVALKLRYSSNFKNNGKVFLSVRDSAKELGSGQEEICAWYKELQFYGFIVMTQSGQLGVEGKGLSPHWRLTELGYMTDPPTRDFLKWDGIKFKRRKRASRVLCLRYQLRARTPQRHLARNYRSTPSQYCQKAG